MCDTPYYIKTESFRYIDDQYTNNIPVDCGKCPVCHKKRLRQWMFRLREEDKVSTSAYFLTLTYDQKHVPRTANNLKTLCKRDLQLFLKRLRKSDKKKFYKDPANYWRRKKSIKYYAVGEYGGQTTRPHYHLIIFNIYDLLSTYQAWERDGYEIGTIHVGTVEKASIAYTLKYLQKTAQIPAHKNDDRVKEFSLKSQKLGRSYLTPNVIKYHKENLDKPYLISDGYKVSLPKYYKNLLYSESETEQVNDNINELRLKQKMRQEVALEKRGKRSAEEDREMRKMARYGSHNKNLNKRNKV